jgi:hypothetical protein
MDTAYLKDIETDDEIRKNLAKWIVHDCFRNDTGLEGLHERITNDEMKSLMINAVNNTYLFLTVLLFSPADQTDAIIDLLKSKNNLQTQAWNKWDDPVLLEDRIKSHANLYRQWLSRRNDAGQGEQLTSA